MGGTSFLEAKKYSVLALAEPIDCNPVYLFSFPISFFPINCRQIFHCRYGIAKLKNAKLRLQLMPVEFFAVL